MAKLKAPTPQELYRSRKQQEEQERLSLLPPGLINHGNTCFMNSVLQGLLATRLLSQLVHFEPVPQQVQEHSNVLLASQRSPQLTNGHELGGSFEQEWVDSMPIGDVFIGIMYRAWEAQRLRKRESLSPRALLTVLGRKYDQYLDFAQQDAHEFMRILLDAMRMEEFDVIKTRQPPPARKRRRRRTTITPNDMNSLPDKADHTHEDPSTQLMTLSDMLFGGQLTSILVCQKCKHVSQTYEDFNDLSLSIKAEDYAKGKRRDRLKKLAQKMGMGGGGAGKGKRVVSTGGTDTTADLAISPPVLVEEISSSAPIDVPTSPIRASSVPPSPNPGGTAEYESNLSLDNGRRRSLDGLTNGGGNATATSDEDDVVVVTTDSDSSEKPLPPPPGLGPGPTTPDEKRSIEFAEVPKVEHKALKDKDGWARIGRRISMSVGIGKGAKEKGKEGKEREKETSRSRSRSRKISGSSLAAKDSPTILLSRPSVSLETPQPTPMFLKRRALSSQDQATIKSSKSKSRPQSLSPRPLDDTVPTLNADDSTPKLPYVRSKSPNKPPKPKPKSSKAEEEYLRAILADVNPTPVYGAKPFDFLTNWHLPLNANGNANGDDSQASAVPSASGSSSSVAVPTPTSRTAWLAKLGQLPLAGIEECMKMFTAVEVLEGENMVGCRRCWKLANGGYEEKGRREREAENSGDDDDEEDDGDDSADEESDEDGDDETESEDVEILPPTPLRDGEDIDPTERQLRPTSSAPASPPVSPTISHNNPILSFSSPTLPLYALENTSDHFSVLSSPPNGTGKSNRDSLVASDRNHRPTSTPSETVQYVPSIRTTHAEDGRDSTSLLTARPKDEGQQSDLSTTNGEANDVLLSVPSLSNNTKNTQESDSNATDSSSDGGESDSASISTTASVTPSGPSPDDDSFAGTSVTGLSLAASLKNNNNGQQQRPHPPALKLGSSTHIKSSSTVSSSRARSRSGPLTKKKKSSKGPKPVVMRPAYKRYLIATPPPILVIHLKRFQQINKNPIMSFSNGFKKLEDYVAFPEFLDLTPFLAPKKEDFGLGKKHGRGDEKDLESSGGGKRKLSKGDKENKERCMYRLYAVVVHIGNMLGGHYISYTALPNSSEIPPQTTPTPGQADSTNLPPPPPSPASGTRQWAHISDTVVRLTTLEEVLKAKAYICMYERV